MKKLFVLITFIILNSTNLFAQWQTDERLTNDGGYSFLSYNNARCLAVNGNILHVVWYDTREGNWELFYKRSTDMGITWESDVTLTNYDNLISSFPSIAVSGNNVYVVWDDSRNNNNEIYFKRSTDQGLSWSTDNRLTNNSAYSLNPSLAVSDSFLHVVWGDSRDGNTEIYYKRSTDGGISWEADLRMTNNPNTSVNASIAISDSLAIVVWEDSRNGNYEIYYKLSTDSGTNWSVDLRLTNTAAISRHPSVVIASSVIHVIWEDTPEVQPEIYYQRSTDAGNTWEAQKRLTNDQNVSEFPSIAASGSVLHAVWSDRTSSSQTEIYYNRSIDAGLNWESNIRLTDATGLSDFPMIAISGSDVHTIWRDNRDGNLEIYYKKNPSGNVTSLENIKLELPEKYVLEQNYPNPFNPSTKIKYTIPYATLSGAKWSQVQLKVYDVLGNEVTTLINEVKPAGNYEVDFNASKFSSGVYFYKLQAGEFISTKKMTLIK
jgi:hypothetical protein